MYKILRIIFTLLSAACVAVVIPVGTLFDLTWALIVGISAGVFFLVAMICKQAQEKREPTKDDCLEENSINSDNEE